MGSTAKFNFPYPELADEANPPADFKRLADAIDAVLGNPVPLPPAAVSRYAADQALPEVAQTRRIGNQAATIRNTSATNMLVRCTVAGWMYTTGTTVGYVDVLIISGAHTLISSMGGARVGSALYREYVAEKQLYIPAGGNVQIGIAGRRLSGGTAILRNTTLSMLPVSYTTQTLPPYDPESEIESYSDPGQP